MKDVVLPEQFSGLAPFIDWALPGADDRQNHRRASNKADIRAFYDGVLPRLEAILAEVDKYPMGKHHEGEVLLRSILLDRPEIRHFHAASVPTNVFTGSTLIVLIFTTFLYSAP